MNRWNSLQEFWNRLSARERGAVALTAVAVTVMLLWWLTLAPALQSLKLAQAQAPRLEAQLQAMRTLQAQAQALQARPKLGRDEALRALESSVKSGLGAGAQFTLQGERATVLLKGVPAQALAQWLAQARINARALPTEARLQRSTNAANATDASWDGNLVLTLPIR